MRRNFRRKQQNDKIIVYSIAGVIVLLTIVFALLMYGDSLNKEERTGRISSDRIASIAENTADSESTSSSIGKTVSEGKEEIKEDSKNETATNSSNAQNNINKTSQNTLTNNTLNATAQTSSTTKVEQKSNNTISKKEESKKELSFQMPVDGEVMREFAKENLIYSETLQEWITHAGIDIKAEKATVVQAAEDGTIKSIKNDPRYGLTIVIEHEDGFETVYANLLSSEFVVEGEKVIKGQSIGTVGNTAVFESADEPHLHFEVLKDSIQVDPNIYVK